MQAYHNDPALKAKLLVQVRAHRAADEIIHDHYWTGTAGCAVGCALHSGDHALAESQYGIPAVLVHLADSIFERLEPPHDLDWPEQFWSSPQVGADLSGVWPRFAVALLTDPGHGVARYAQAPQWRAQAEAVERVAALYRAEAAGNAVGIARAAKAAEEAAGGTRAARAAEVAWATAEALVYPAGAAWAVWAAAETADRVAAEAPGSAETTQGGTQWQAATLLQFIREVAP